MTGILTNIRRSLTRDRELPLRVRVAKGADFLVAMALAPARLRSCTRVGARARAIGRPRIDNRGRITIGSDFVSNSTFTPVDLSTSPTGCIEIGDRVAINYGTSIFSAARVRIGSGVSIGPHSVIWDAEHREVDPGDAEAQAIHIEEGVWLAGRVTVLPGARIGAGSVITAGSVVGGEIPAGVVAGGIPARVLRRVDDHAASASAVMEQGSAAAEASSGEVASAPAPSSRVSAASTAAAARSDRSPAMRGVVLADFTIGDLAVRLRDERQWPPLEVAHAPFGQVMQSLLQDAPEGATDFAVVWTRPEVISRAFQAVLHHEETTDAELVADVDLFVDVVTRAAAQYRVVLVPTWTVPAHHRGLGMIDTRPGGITWALTLMNQRLMQQLGGNARVFVLNAQRWVNASGDGAASERAWYMGKVALHGEALAEAARDIKAAVAGIAGHARKLLIVDLDDTMWGGIVGDVGWENLRLGGHDAVGEAFVDFQHGVKQLTRRGIVLGIASKNTESVALEAMRSHPAMVLRPDDFVAMRINWGDKARNIAEIAEDLNLGLQSVVFIDDNPVERARVRETLPEVFVPEWPEDKLLYPSALRSLTCFDAPTISKEDLQRTAMYAAERKRDVLKQEVGSLDDWLMSLEIRVRAEPLGPANLARTTQLFNKTNQMNLSTRRLTEAELLEWTRDASRALWTITVSDRFGDAGLTGIVSAEADGDCCRIVDFILSCRVMGRQVEESMVHLAVEWARQRALCEVVAHYRPTAKNKPCHEFWKRSRFSTDAAEERFVWDAREPYPLPACITLDQRD